MIKFFKTNKSSKPSEQDFNTTLSFETSLYQQHNIARLQHLDSLGLDLSRKKVIELGAGIGDHTLFYLYRNCEVLPIEGRPELVEHINKRLGIHHAVKIDFENELYKLKNYKDYDYIHCYGLLYHLSNPLEFLNSLSNLGNTLLLETCVSSDFSSDPINLKKENKIDKTQAISGLGCRPTRWWIHKVLKENFKYVYFPITQPKHIEFPLSWDNEFISYPNNIRAIFIASHTALNSPKLTMEFIKQYTIW